MIATITRQQVGTVERALQIFMKLGLVEPLQKWACSPAYSFVPIAEASCTSRGIRRTSGNRTVTYAAAITSVAKDRTAPSGGKSRTREADDAAIFA